MADITVVHRDAIVTIATSRNLVVAVWSDAPDLPQMHAFERALAATRRSHPTGAALLDLIRSGTPRFSDAVRREAQRLSGTEYSALGVAHLVTVPGLAGSATRAFLSTVMLLARTHVPTRVFGEPREALAWLAERLAAGAEPWTVADLADVYKKATAV